MSLAKQQTGLNERRVMKEFADNFFPAIVKNIQTRTGYNIEIEVQWEGLYYQVAGCQFWIENFKKVYFEPIENALASICKDDMGKQALQSKIKKISICNTDGKYRNCWSIKNMVLEFDHGPDMNVDNVEARTNDLVSFLESNL